MESKNSLEFQNKFQIQVMVCILRVYVSLSLYMTWIDSLVNTKLGVCKQICNFKITYKVSLMPITMYYVRHIQWAKDVDKACPIIPTWATRWHDNLSCNKYMGKSICIKCIIANLDSLALSLWPSGFLFPFTTQKILYINKVLSVQMILAILLVFTLLI